MISIHGRQYPTLATVYNLVMITIQTNVRENMKIVAEPTPMIIAGLLVDTQLYPVKHQP